MESNADRLIELFHEAKARPFGAERDRFLREACRGKPEIQQQVLSLLEADQEAGDFLGSRLAHLPEAFPAEKPGDKLGHYKLLEQIGEGGCGVVYLAEQEEPVRRRVALKIIKLGMDTRAVVARFEAERQALALMDHPNIARVFEAGSTATGRPYFVMELVRGKKITDYCEREELRTDQRLRLFMQVCQAVQHAHQKGIIHRDLKPSNVLVTHHDGVPVPKVIDFGIAKATGDQQLTDKTVFTALDQFIGTPAYMSPEQAETSGLDIDTRSDIYSLGVLLYELLTGVTPFDTQELLRSGLEGTRKIIREREPPRPSTRLKLGRSVPHSGTASPSQIANLKSKIDPDLDWIVMKCLEKDRTRRYPTANGLAADLERHLSNEPVVARPPSTWYRMRTTMRKHKLAFAGAVVILASLVLGLSASLWQTIKVSRAQRDTQRQAYVFKMNLARQAWDDNNLGRLRELLEDTATEPDRGFEWYYWQRQSHLELKTLRGHLGPVVDVSFSPDGQRALTASLDGTARVWDRQRGTELLRIAGHDREVRSASWSPNGQLVVTAGADRTAAVWEAASGKELLRLKGHSGGLTSARFSPDGQHIASASFDGTARLWRADTGEQLFSMTNADAVCSVRFSPDGKRMVTASFDERATVWDAATGTALYSIRPPSARIEVRGSGMFTTFNAAFSPDGQHIATASQNQSVNLWDAADGHHLLELKGPAHWLSPRQMEVPLVTSFSPNSQRLILGGLDFTASIWSLKDRTSLFKLKGHEAEIACAAFSEDGRYIVTGSYDHTAKIWSGAGSTESLTLGLQKKIVPGAVFSPDGGRIVTASWDGTAIVWDAATGAPVRTLDHGSNSVWSVNFSSDGARILTGTADGSFNVWDAFTGVEILKGRGHTGELHTVSFSRDGKRILTAAADWTARLWDATTGQELRRFNHNQYGVMAAFSPDGRRIATVCNDNNRNTLERATAAVWDAETGRKSLSLEGHVNGFSAIAWSPNGRFIVTGSIDWTATVWDAYTGRKLLPPLRGHRGQVIHVAISPDSRRIFTGGFDNTTRVWDVSTGQELLTLRGQLLVGPGISRDGQRITAGTEPPVFVFEAASPQLVETWREEERLAAERLKEALRSSNLPVEGPSG
jgi:WD40 repeat protein